ncbi:MAG: hypothetical protein IJM68_01140 [Synergistaceae bacterium]|nr:hypothetical protein [Synergistaceae bacterium]
MLKNNGNNVQEISEAWDDLLGDIGALLEGVEITLDLGKTIDGHELTARERAELEELREKLDNIQVTSGPDIRSC